MRIAEEILAEEDGSVNKAEVVVIQNRLLEHFTGKKPIKGDEWLNEELKREKPKKRKKRISQSSWPCHWLRGVKAGKYLR